MADALESTGINLPLGVIMRYYIDCEFDGHNGPLLSVAVVRNDLSEVYIKVLNDATDPWVIANVLPVMGMHKSKNVQCLPEVAVWPDAIRVGNVVGKNESDDTHDSKEQAEAVCKLLEKEGFGGDGNVFPISTRVEPVFESEKP